MVNVMLIRPPLRGSWIAPRKSSPRMYREIVATARLMRARMLPANHLQEHLINDHQSDYRCCLIASAGGEQGLHNTNHHPLPSNLMRASTPFETEKRKP